MLSSMGAIFPERKKRESQKNTANIVLFRTFLCDRIGMYVEIFEVRKSDFYREKCVDKVYVLC